MIEKILSFISKKRTNTKNKELFLLDGLNQIVHLQEKLVYETSRRLLETLGDNGLLDEYEQITRKFILNTLNMHSLGAILNTMDEHSFMGVSKNDLERMKSYLSSLEPVERKIANLKILDLEFKLIWHIIYQIEPKDVTLKKIQSSRKEFGFHPSKITEQDTKNA